jgi:hypothetical protein
MYFGDNAGNLTFDQKERGNVVRPVRAFGS